MFKKISILTLAISILGAGALMLAGCGGGGGGGGSSVTPGGSFTTGGGTPQRDSIDNYVNGFIIPVLTDLDNSAGALLQTVQALVQSPTAETLASARAAWVRTRIPWEQSETALFGPVDFYGFDPALDTWPVNQTDLEGVLASGSPLTAQSISNLDNSLKGFHTIEYLIYGVDGSKLASQLTSREAEYLTAVTENLKGVTQSLLAAWIAGFDGQPPFAREVVRAGQGSAVFPTELSAIEQFIRGIVVICDEVANGKIADPFDQRNPNIVESQFSGNSLADFANNILGARAAYETAISDLVVTGNPALDTKTLAAFDNAVAAIRRIPEPFLAAIQNSANDNMIRSAQQAIRSLQNTVEGEVLPTVLTN